MGDGDFGKRNHLITGSHDRSIRLWEKTAELLVLQEEQEIEREKGHEEAMLEEQVVPVVGEKSGDEVELVTKKSLDTIKSAELLITALEICRLEKEAEAEADVSGEKRQRHPLLVAMKSSSLDTFLVDILRKINSAELEKSLLLLSFAESLELLTLLANALEKNSSEVELLCRLILFLVKLHHKELTSSSAKPLLDRLNCLVLPKLNQLRDEVGSNLAAMHLIHNRLASADDVQLFADVSRKGGKVKRRKSKTQQDTPIISL